MILFLADFHIPVSDIDKMPPAFVDWIVGREMHERSPSRFSWGADEAHSGCLGGFVALAGIAGDAGADDVFPGGGTTGLPRNHVVQIQVRAVKYFAAVLAGVLVSFKNVVAGEFDFFLGIAIEKPKEDYLGNPQSHGDSLEHFGVWVLRRKISPA